MSDKKMNFKRILKTSGYVALSAGFMLLLNLNKKDKDRALAVTLSSNFPTEFVRDTIPASINIDTFFAGHYDVLADVVHSVYFLDKSGTEDSKYAEQYLNDLLSYTDYHEVRHAFNSRLEMHYHRPITPDIEATDEVSARVAESLAHVGNMRPYLHTGTILTNISYDLSISEPRKLQQVVDAIFLDVLQQMREPVNHGYDKMYAENADIHTEYLPMAYPNISKKALLDEMMTFDINGKQRNMLKMASKNVQKKVYAYINRYNNQR